MRRAQANPVGARRLSKSRPRTLRIPNATLHVLQQTTLHKLTYNPFVDRQSHSKVVGSLLV